MALDGVLYHMKLVSADPHLYRSRSPFLRSHPWQNGVILERGCLRSWVINNKPDSCEGVIAHLIEVGSDRHLLSLHH
jgi:hypothetical protein